MRAAQSKECYPYFVNKRTYTSTLTSKGQITLPIAIRRRLGLKQGDRLEFCVEGNRTLLRPVRNSENPFAAYAGALGGFRGQRQINAWVRGLRKPGRHAPRRRA